MVAEDAQPRKVGCCFFFFLIFLLSGAGWREEWYFKAPFPCDSFWPVVGAGLNDHWGSQAGCPRGVGPGQKDTLSANLCVFPELSGEGPEVWGGFSKGELSPLVPVRGLDSLKAPYHHCEAFLRL